MLFLKKILRRRNIELTSVNTMINLQNLLLEVGEYDNLIESIPKQIKKVNHYEPNSKS
jgi:hypothetical protein